MLYRATIQNFGSIRDRQELDFTISAKVEKEPMRQLAGPAQIRAPRVCVILGANASGKTTALRALSFIIDFAHHSALYPAEMPLLYSPFSDIEAQASITELSIEFTADWVTPGRALPYRYTMIAGPGRGGGGSRRFIEQERLEVKRSSQWSVLIERQNARAVFRREFREFDGAVPAKALERHNASVVSLLLQYVSNDKLVDAVRSTLEGVQSNLQFWFRLNTRASETADIYAKNERTLQALNKFIRRADLGIRSVRLQEVKSSTASESKQWSMAFDHAGLNHPLYDTFESHGTLNFVSLFPSIYRALECGGLALMDEMDSDLHPELLREVTEWFVDDEVNPKGAQLIMTCNNPTILDFLRKEEIYFAKKNDEGRTSLYSLKQIPGVRRTANFQRDYLAGRYGAVPTIG